MTKLGGGGGGKLQIFMAEGFVIFSVCTLLILKERQKGRLVRGRLLVK